MRRIDRAEGALESVRKVLTGVSAAIDDDPESLELRREYGIPVDLVLDLGEVLNL